MRLALPVVVLAIPGCGGSAPPPPPEPLRSPIADVAVAKVFDERGIASACGPPRTDCPSLPPASPFLDRCRMAGFQVRQCGCEARCSGDVAATARHYDAGGQLKECAPARAGCTPPQAGAAFQDACTERGFRLDVCGCEWLCSGDFKR